MCEVWVARAGLDSFGWDGEVSYFNAIEMKGPKAKPEDDLCRSFLLLLFYCPLGTPPTLCWLGLGLI